MNSQPQVLISHAGVQHSYKTALALQSAGMLSRFYTPIYYNPKTFTYWILEKLLGNQSWFFSLKDRRHHPELLSGKVCSVPWFEISYRVGKRLLSSKFEHDLLLAQNLLYDQYIAWRLKHLRENFDFFYGFSGSALHCLTQSKLLGKTTIVDHHDIHQETARCLMQQEIELNPDFRETFPYWPPHEPYLRRLAAEDQLADYHFVLSSFARETYINTEINPKRVFVLPLGVNLQRFSPLADAREMNIFRISFVGAIGQRKGIKYLLEAIKQLALPNAELTLAGNVLGSGQALGPYEKWFRHVRYVEPSAIADFYRRSSVFVLPSIWDSYGQVIVEAMACGIPVIVSENTAGRDVVRDGIDGFVIPIRNTEALAEKLLLLYEDKELRQWMGQNAAVRSQEFSLDSYTKRLIDAMTLISNTTRYGETKLIDYQ